MKNYLIVIILFLILCGCGQKGWDSTYGEILKFSFMSTCEAEEVAGVTSNALSNYCGCVWNLIIEEYSINDMDTMVEGSYEWNQYLSNVENNYAPACFGMLESY